MVWPLVVGGASYVLLAVLAGTLYGISQWRSIFWVMTIEGVLRLVLVGLVLTVTSEPVPLAWAVVAPFAFTALVMWLIVRRGLVGATALDAGYRRLAWNATRTIVAAGSMGLLVSGFPLLLAITSPRETQSQLGLLILAATLTRAPLIVVGMALQSYFIVLFRNSGLRFWRLFLQLEAIVIIAGLVLGCLGWLIGPAVFSFLFPNQPSPPGWLIGVLVSTSALIGAICVSAPAVLSRGKHSVFTAGWVVAGVTTFFGLLLPLPLYERASIALLVGPLAGLAVHVTDLIAFHRRPLAPEALEPASPHIHG
jgi:hypothetical protein